VVNNPINFFDPFGFDKEKKKCENPFPPGMEWLKYYLVVKEAAIPFAVGGGAIVAGTAVATGSILATGAAIAAAPFGGYLVLPVTLAGVAAGEYLIAFGTDVNIGQINALLGTNIPRPHDVAPQIFPGVRTVKICK